MMIPRVLVHASLAAGALGAAIANPGPGLGPKTAITTSSDGQVSLVNTTGVTIRDDFGPLPDHNCTDIIKRYIVPQIDCSYSFENCGFDNHLEYQIKIDPVGMSSEKWCEMLITKIQDFTGNWTFWFMCDRKWRANENGNGLFLRYKIGWPWPEGKDFMEEVQWAIHFSMCFNHPVLTNWVNEGCYRSSVCSTRYWSADRDDSPPMSPSIFKRNDESLMEIGPDSDILMSTQAAKDLRCLPEPELPDPTVSHSPFLIETKTPAEATPPPGIDPDFTCAFVDPSKGLTTEANCSWRFDEANNRLKYQIDIQPTGQDSTNWCDNLVAAIRFTCPDGDGPNRYKVKKCETDVFESPLGKGVSLELDMFSWFKVDSNEKCVKEAIESTTCGIPATFKNGGCYKQ
ncbi:hypothetical protein CcaCcLH18_03185 [Colletotrichum camelliae]|nr:hypothetical protein CcaCcLH18_03185 [Colletotrichum camelliae]